MREPEKFELENKYIYYLLILLHVLNPFRPVVRKAWGRDFQRGGKKTFVGRQKIQKKHLKKYITIREKASRVSADVSYLKEKNLKSHTIRESLILRSAIKMTSIKHREKYGNDL